MVNEATIQQALTPLVGLPLRIIGRAGNLLWLQLGDLREVTNRRGATKTVGDWALHISSAWRLCTPARIVVAYRDYYYGPDGDDLDDWDLPGKNRFDSIAARLNAEWKAIAPCVLSFKVDDVGGFSLNMSQNYRLDVFPDNSSDGDSTEYWRLFKSSSEVGVLCRFANIVIDHAKLALGSQSSTRPVFRSLQTLPGRLKQPSC